MTEAKSTLKLSMGSKKQLSPALGIPVVEFKSMDSQEEAVELSDQQKQAQFNRQHEEYMRMKTERKKQLMRLKKEDFGTSSSDDDANDSISDDDQSHKQPPTSYYNFSGKKNQPKQSFPSNLQPVLLQLKKSTIETELIFHESAFQINKKMILVNKMSKISLLRSECINQKNYNKIRVSFYNDEDASLFIQTDKYYQSSIESFRKLLKLKLKSLGLTNQTKNPLKNQQFSQPVEGVWMRDKIYKKSQIIGNWEERYVSIKAEGVYSSKSATAKHSMFIEVQNIKEIVIDFTLYKQFLVLRVVYSNTKTDFGIPFDPNIEWLSPFCKLITV